MEKEDLILKPAYRGIIFLTMHFQEKTNQKGLRLLHYRFALVEKDEIESYWKREMEKFFDWKEKEPPKSTATAKQINIQSESQPAQEQEKKRVIDSKLRVFQDMNEITRCIPTRQALIERLHRLCDFKVLTLVSKEIVTIDNKDRKVEYDPPVYRISKEQYKELDEIYRKHILKTLCINEIEKYPYEKLYELEEKINVQLLFKKLAENYPKYF